MSTSPNVSGKLDRTSTDLLLAVQAAASSLPVEYFVVGAFARDVVLGLCYGIPTGEATRDVDFGLMLNDWAQFDALRSRLLGGGDFTEARNMPHRLRFRGTLVLDLVPFGGIERAPGEIAWPPEFSTVMSTVGFREAYARTLSVTVDGKTAIPFALPLALALLKLIAWSERGTDTNRKDARDLALILRTYLQAGNESRLYSEHADMLDDPDFDLDRAGARMLGRDLQAMLNGALLTRIRELVQTDSETSRGTRLVRDMAIQPQIGAALLKALRSGLSDAQRAGPKPPN
jgi:predicted nucleotidyltransferase